MATYIGRGVNKKVAPEDKVIKLTAELETVKNVNAELTAQVDTLSAENGALIASNEELTNANEDLTAANAELTAQVEKLSKKDKTADK